MPVSRLKQGLFAAVTVVVASTAVAQAAPRFAPPVRMKAGEKYLGEGRRYPSPVFHDVNGDGLPDVVVGDLAGVITVALRVPGNGPARYSYETRLKAGDGKVLVFHNW